MADVDSERDKKYDRQILSPQARMNLELQTLPVVKEYQRKLKKLLRVTFILIVPVIGLSAFRLIPLGPLDVGLLWAVLFALPYWLWTKSERKEINAWKARWRDNEREYEYRQRSAKAT